MFLPAAGYYNQNNFDSANYFLLKAAESPGDLLANRRPGATLQYPGCIVLRQRKLPSEQKLFQSGAGCIQEVWSRDQGMTSVQLNMATCYYRLVCTNRR